MKKFLFVRLGYFPDDPRLKKQVIALIEDKCKVDIVCLRKKGEKLSETVNGINVLRLPLQHRRASFIWYLIEYSIGFILIFFTVTFKFLRNKYDFILVHTLPDYLTFTAIIPKILGAKVVTDFHEPTPELIMTKYNLSKKHILTKLAVFTEQLVISFSDFSIAVTNALRKRYIDFGADPAKVFVVSNAVDTSNFQINSDAIKKYANNDFRIISHGTIEKRYGHEIVIRAVNKLKYKYPYLKFVITGSGTYTNKLKELVKKLNCGKNIEFLGYLSFKDLLGNLSHSDAGIISMFKTPYSMLIDTNKMYEYLELKLPVIAPKLTPLEENFRDGEVTFFEPGNFDDLADKIEFSILNQEVIKNRVKAASQKYENIKWSVVKKNFVSLFDNNTSFNKI